MRAGLLQLQEGFTVRTTKGAELSPDFSEEKSKQKGEQIVPEGNRSSTDNYLMRDTDEVTKSLFHLTRVYVTGPGGSGKKEEEDTRHRKPRKHGSGRVHRRPLRAANSSFHLCPSRSCSPVHVTALAPSRLILSPKSQP